MREPKPKFQPEARKCKKTGELITGNVPVFLRFSARGRLVYYTGIRVDTFKWDYDQQRAKANTVHEDRPAQWINAKLARMEELITNYVAECKLYRKTIDLNFIKQELDRQEKDLEPIVEKPQVRLKDFFEPYLDDRKRQRGWSAGIVKHIEVIFNQITPLAGNAFVFDISDDLFEQYRDLLADNGCRDVTIKNKVARLKWYLKWLIDKGYITGDNANAILKYAPKLNKMKDKEKAKLNIAVALNETELKAVEKIQLDEMLDVIRDGFLFSCETGLRYGDLLDLKKTDCTASHINIVSSKDVEALKIPLSKRAKLLLKKHKDTNTETAFPLPCMEVANRHLKTIGMLAKLDRVLTDVYFKNGKRVTETKQLFQKLTTHVARKTFVTQSIAKGISPAVIMKITGHADYKTMQNYIDVAGDTVTKEMEKLNKL